MTNAFQLFRSLTIYGLCLPLAVFIGYLLANPYDPATFFSIVGLMGFLAFPLLLRWHYPVMIFCWNGAAGFYFLPGKPSWIILMAYASFSVAIFSYILNRKLKFISASPITRPLIFLTVVVLATARLTGGIGFGALGAAEGGGKRYVSLFAGVVGFYALIARPIPREKVDNYVGLFYLGGLTALVGNLFLIASPAFYPIFQIFPAEIVDQSSHAFSGNDSIARLAGLSTSCMALISFMLVRYGLRSILDFKKPSRTFLFLALAITSMFGGFRSRLIELLLILFLLFVMEGLIHSRVLPVTILMMILAGAFVVPFSDKLPLSIQRSLTFLPLKLDPNAELNAKFSSEWRVQMWRYIIPQIPKYLIVGKGYGIDTREMEIWESASDGTDSNVGAAMAGDYHNGPLSVIVPFGIPGVIAFLWFLGASVRVLYRNFLFGDPELKKLNRFLLASFCVKIVLFLFVFGSFYTELVLFTGVIGLSIAINHGIKKPVAMPITKPVFNRFKLAHALR